MGEMVISENFALGRLSLSLQAVKAKHKMVAMRNNIVFFIIFIFLY